MVYCTAAYPVAIGELPVGPVLRDVDDQVECMLRNHLHHVHAILVLLVRPRHGYGFHSVVVEELGCARSGVDGVAGLVEHMRTVEYGNLALRLAAAYHYALFL